MVLIQLEWKGGDALESSLLTNKSVSLYRFKNKGWRPSLKGVKKMAVLKVKGLAEDLTLSSVRKSVYSKLKRAKAQGNTKLEFKTVIDHKGNSFDVVTSLAPFWATKDRNGGTSSTYAMGSCTISGLVKDKEYKRMYKILGTLVSQGNKEKSLTLQPYYSERFGSKEHMDNFDKVMEQTLVELFPKLFTDLDKEVLPSMSDGDSATQGGGSPSHFRKVALKRGCSRFAPDINIVAEKEANNIEWRRVCGNCTENGDCLMQARLREQVKIVGVNMPANA